MLKKFLCLFMVLCISLIFAVSCQKRNSGDSSQSDVSSTENDDDKKNNINQYEKLQTYDFESSKLIAEFEDLQLWHGIFACYYPINSYERFEQFLELYIEGNETKSLSEIISEETFKNNFAIAVHFQYSPTNFPSSCIGYEVHNNILNLTFDYLGSNDPELPSPSITYNKQCIIIIPKENHEFPESISFEAPRTSLNITYKMDHIY